MIDCSIGNSRCLHLEIRIRSSADGNWEICDPFIRKYIISLPGNKDSSAGKIRIPSLVDGLCEISDPSSGKRIPLPGNKDPFTGGRGTENKRFLRPEVMIPPPGNKDSFISGREMVTK